MNLEGESKRVPVVLIVDDEDGLRRLLTKLLKREGFNTIEAQDAFVAQKVLLEDKNIDAILLDIMLPKKRGDEFLVDIKSIDPDVEVIMMTAHASVDVAVRCMKEGAYDFIIKPFESNEYLATLVKKAIEKTRLNRRTKRLERAVSNLRYKDFVTGKSRIMYELMSKVERYAQLDFPVLIIGETGTGKESIARILHDHSRRADKPFITVDCSILSDELFVSELFGHKKGSFSGAITDRVGLLRAADGGTVFFDEIGELSLNKQVKLLRFLEAKKIRPIGENIEFDVDVRVIAATNRDLERMVGEGTFREDLFYRLNVLRIDMPPLRERREDIPELAYFFSRKAGMNRFRFKTSTLKFMMNHNWPGNIRELRNFVFRIIAEGEEAVSFYSKQRQQDRTEDKKIDELKGIITLKDYERLGIAITIKKTKGNVEEAARILGVSRSTLYRLLKKHRIKY